MEKQDILKELFKQRETLNNLINKILEEENPTDFKSNFGVFHENIENVIAKSALILGYSFKDFTDKKVRATRDLHKHRRFCWYYLREKTAYTLEEIAEVFQMNYSNISIGIKKVGEETSLYLDTKKEYNSFENLLTKDLF